MRLIFYVTLLCLSSTAVAQDAPLIPTLFEWPERQSDVIGDLRIRDDVSDARESARQATTRASEGRRAVGQAKRRAGLQGSFGIKPERATLGGDTEVALTRGRSNGATLGTITYSTGAIMTGAFGPNVGVYFAEPESPLRQFSGWVWGAGSPTPRPMDGIFEWKNGDIFTGSITGDASASKGVYVKADGQFRFVGVIDLSQSQFRPIRGYLEGASGKLLAVVRQD